ncbi:phosphate ABC transporter, inner membrane subunit PstC [Xylanimonas cellulosilytica DSM 15894]|uniref:Phosphate transport system permease protein n=1 Tax=Xylanimonas cellulosilytica (strain DSM 15894 / JCM 12276 / CECT 5975 / KCTC 9989 / LMG 20990 / NBRC 107835 / XIL07) TaxID=446471 RepID=D1BZ72_XYLCX|nr:phosphate ABC transporter permease subunit PstC [Xylanimonas cellulosilytica]ACZ31969.1 phosphate ABC transporter, inner membrane subunit PstC [Xylanimonas cellulosilytica DSM 15894]
MTTTAHLPDTEPPAPVRRRRRGDTERGVSRVFRWVSTGSAVLLLAVLAAVAIFLVQRGLPALTAPAERMRAEGGLPQGVDTFAQYIGPLVFGTLLAAAMALALATPVAVGIALFISHYAPRRLAAGIGYVVDLLAAIPSVVFGLWGGSTLAPVISTLWVWLAGVLDALPFLEVQATRTGRSLATAAVVLAVMVLPIITAVAREVFLQTPRLHEEAALALGATRWEVIKTAVLPFGRSGVISAAMLGLGRALGETMAVLMILSPGLLYSFQIFDAGQQQTIAANIASKFPEASGLAVNTLIATGLALFVITMAVNMLARWIVARRKDFSGAN